MVPLLLLALLGLWARGLCQEDAVVYIVAMKQLPAAHYYDQLKRFRSSAIGYGSSGAFATLNKPRSLLSTVDVGFYSSILLTFASSFNFHQFSSVDVGFSSSLLLL